eukprot:1281894-Pyramimonas_sp.AAC.1
MSPRACPQVRLPLFSGARPGCRSRGLADAGRRRASPPFAFVHARSSARTRPLALRSASVAQHST